MGNSGARVTALKQRGSQQGIVSKVAASFADLPIVRENILGEEIFHAMLTLERRRAERSQKLFALMLIDVQGVQEEARSTHFFRRLTSTVSSATRETDIIGWFEKDAILGVIFTEIHAEAKTPIPEILRSKVLTALQVNLVQEERSNLVVSIHILPEGENPQGSDRAIEFKICEDLSRKVSKRHFPNVIKRGIDIIGSGFFLLIFSPIFAAIALAIKLTSKGPVIFRQERVGRFGTKFDCLKFRTMHTNSDPKIHREYVQRLIAGNAENQDQSASESAVYKIVEDPRVTAVGKLLRRLSLDEFPQFWNVLRGEMSLVGPRPPLQYEFEVYDSWHRRRVMEMKPGITGLWQVSGRSRVSFDDMVRLDLRYSQGWSLWLDLKILLATPLAVLTGDGAY